MKSSLKSLLPVLLWLTLTLIACKPFDSGVAPVPTSPEKVDGWAPIYDSTNTSRTIAATAPRAISKGGRIYIKDSLLFQVEAGRGIHVIYLRKDAQQQLQPEKLAFITIAGCQEMSVSGTTLYTNNLNDLVAVNIADPLRPVLLDRISNAFHIFDEVLPPSSGWYECPNSARGKVVGWEIKSLKYPQCSK